MPTRATALLTRYRSLGLAPPRWAFPLPPSIPFVGKEYGRWGGLVVYASAENLSYYERNPERVPVYLKDDRVLNRHRAALDESHDGFFPNVHMAPFSDGSLLVAAWYLVWRRFGDPPDEPRALLESIAGANFCKFAIAGARNRDYAGDRERVGVSLPYIRADLKVLQPATVILPRTIWKLPGVRAEFEEVVPKAEILPLPQFNPQVVNTHLRNHAERAAVVEQELKGTVLPSWVAWMKGYAAGVPNRFLVEMDEMLGAREPGSVT